MKMKLLWGGKIFHLIVWIQSYSTPPSKANVHTLVLIFNKILCLACLKMSFDPDRDCHIQISNHKHPISFSVIVVWKAFKEFTLDNCLLRVTTL